MTSPATYIETMRFPGEGINGGWAYNVKVSSGNSYWVSPLIKLTITDEEEVKRHISDQVKVLTKAMLDN